MFVERLKKIYYMHFDGFVLKSRNIYMPYLIKKLPVSNTELGKLKHNFKAKYMKSTWR